MDMSDVKMCESQPLPPDTDAPFEELVVAVPEEPWKLPVDVPRVFLM